MIVVGFYQGVSIVSFSWAPDRFRRERHPDVAPAGADVHAVPRPEPGDEARAVPAGVEAHKVLARVARHPEAPGLGPRHDRRSERGQRRRDPGRAPRQQLLGGRERHRDVGEEGAAAHVEPPRALRLPEVQGPVRRLPAGPAPHRQGAAAGLARVAPAVLLDADAGVVALQNGGYGAVGQRPDGCVGGLRGPGRPHRGGVEEAEAVGPEQPLERERRQIGRKYTEVGPCIPVGIQL